MKKLLALVLAMVMTLGLATVGTGAAYSDAADIDYTEAVDVMTAIEVFDGMDGAFNPDGNLTREQGAKIIAYMILGKKNADALTASANPFVDVAADRWSAGAIAFCTNEGIISGVGDGKFDPTGTLTGHAFAKMCLTALGYKSEVEGYTGADWAINVATQAFEAGLNDGLNITMSQPITRQEACQMSLNTLKGTLVKYTGGTNITTTDGTTVVSGAQRSDVTIGSAGDRKYDYIVGGTNDGYVQFVERYYSNPTLKLNKGSADDFKRPANTWTLGTKAIGDYAQTPDATYTVAVKGGTIYTDLGKPAITVGTTVINKYRDGANAYSTDSQTIATLIASGNTTDLAGSGRGIKTEVFYDSNTGKIDIVQTTTFLAQAVADYNATTKKLTIQVDGSVNITSISGEDFPVVESAKKDDYFYITAANTSGTTWVVETVEKVPASAFVLGVTASAKNSSSVTAGGTTYSFAKKLSTSAGAFHDDTGITLTSAKYDLILDPYGYVLAANSPSGDTANADNILFVYDAAPAGMSLDASIIKMDGTAATVKIAKVNKNTVTSPVDGYTTSGTTVYKRGATVAFNNADEAKTANLVVAGGFYKYSTSNDGYVLTYIPSSAIASQTITAGEANQFSGATTADGKTALVAGKTISSLSAFLGAKNFPGVTSSAAYYTSDDPVAKAIVMLGADPDSKTASKYVYLFSSPTTKDDNGAYYTFANFLDGEYDGTGIDATDANSGLFQVKYASNGRLDNSGTALSAGSAANTYMVDNVGEITVSNGNISVVSSYVAGQAALYRRADAVAATYGVLPTTTVAGLTKTYTLADNAVFYHIVPGDKATSSVINSAFAPTITAANKVAVATTNNGGAPANDTYSVDLTEVTVFMVATSSTDRTIKEVWIIDTPTNQKKTAQDIAAGIY